VNQVRLCFKIKKRILLNLDSKSSNILDHFIFFLFNRKDEFIIECPNLGELHKILIGHDNKGRASGWFLDQILIEDLHGNRIYEFPCNKWLAVDEDDRQISRFLLPKTTTCPGNQNGVKAGK
jgi:hypothetical protein